MPNQLDQRLDQPALDFAHRDFARVHRNQTTGEAIASVQGANIESRIVYFYVLDEDERLVGVVPTRRLLLSPPETPIEKIMVQRMVMLPADATLLDACDLFLMHKLLALPIVDEEKRLIGVVDIEQYADEIHDLDVREQAADIFQLIGVRISLVRDNSVWKHFTNRFPWLLCNIGGGLACALVAGLFQGVLNEVIALALFIPVVLALAESVSIQSLTITLQAQHGNQVKWDRVLTTFARELPLGMLLGLSCGLLVGLVAWFWPGDHPVALTLLASIGLSVTAATLFGLLVPSILLAVQSDPRVASGPITLALTDITTTVLYLGLATWWLL